MQRNVAFICGGFLTSKAIFSLESEEGEEIKDV